VPRDLPNAIKHERGPENRAWRNVSFALADVRRETPPKSPGGGSEALNAQPTTEYLAAIVPVILTGGSG